MPTHDEIVSTFVDYYRDQIARIAGIAAKYKDPEDHYVQTYQKILLVALLDALAKSVFPRREANHDRFVGLIRKFSNWDDADRVSLTHVAALAKKRPEPEYEKLRAFSFEKLTKWIPDGRLIYLDNDPEPKELESLWPVPKDYQDAGKKDWKCERFQHASLLYQLRNSLIHEFRKRGIFSNDAEIDQDKPYYMHYQIVEEPTHYWTLFYPRKFLQKVCETSLSNLEAYLRQNQLDPNLHYARGDFWIDELN